MVIFGFRKFSYDRFNVEEVNEYFPFLCCGSGEKTCFYWYRFKQIKAYISSAKTVDRAKIEQHVQYMSDHVDQLFNYYNKSSASFRF
ncbi:hypothetical protein RO3G_14130 [Rhizopus delemar RA 99-880]|uniref:Uncharacterized protein n=1 Tax=Rhizopus delemar (strain RA 99-880 / ATCC MYA-4621 / FGSC 9543 / NRRL 43880) TaxID=246409 RepID=I1CLT9_RHIO9|nr:hypothetical protein RO3G_14130 [Rhizopus delemar RA 99-880]|eukprot:EIE89419.1 hypothetical protein RO3G_14130 [Rhizopus delemar RA 99-880]